MWILDKLQSYGDMPIHKHAIDSMIYGSYLLYAIAFTGVLSLNPDYISILDIITQVYISLFLIIRFNPLVKKSGMTSLDRNVAFRAGIFLLLSSAATSITNMILDYLK
jgi:hypothetical protein